jgi:predicted membrane protein
MIFWIISITITFLLGSIIGAIAGLSALFWFIKKTGIAVMNVDNVVRVIPYYCMELKDDQD